METILINGKEVKEKKINNLRERVNKLLNKDIQPHLVVVQVGQDPASVIYINHKEKACEGLGMKFTKVPMPENTTEEELRKKIFELNNDSKVDGILVQFPLPKHLAHVPVTTLIDHKKDADGMHPFNQGLNMTREGDFGTLPCTPNGVMTLFKHYNIDLTSKKAVVIGRSNIVGRPMTILLTNANATVTTLHTRTTPEDFKNFVKEADVIVTATGIADAITPDMVKEGVVIADVGIIRNENNKIRGDVKYQDFIGKASYITPVPGGVGPMTVAMLMENVVTLAEHYRGKNGQ